MRRGRPILVTVRVPLSVKSCLDIGLDIRTYLEEDLMDIMIAGQDYIQMGVASSLKDMVELGHAHQVPVYALLVPPKPYDRYRFDNRAWWGAGDEPLVLGRGRDLSVQSLPTKPDERFSQLGSVETLKGRDKIYAIDNPVKEDVLGTFKMVMVGPNRLPITVVPGKPAVAKLPVGEDIVANTPEGETVSATLRLWVSGIAEGDVIRLRFNGKPLEKPAFAKPLSAAPGAAQLQVEVDPGAVKAGYNAVEIGA